MIIKLAGGGRLSAVERRHFGIYIEAVQWVDLSNTLGMSQFPNGSILATTPYVSYARYIQRMRDYWGDCRHDHLEATGLSACLFSPPYWHFVDRHRERLSDNPRMGMLYCTWQKMKAERRRALLNRANKVLHGLDEL